MPGFIVGLLLAALVDFDRYWQEFKQGFQDGYDQRKMEMKK